MTNTTLDRKILKGCALITFGSQKGNSLRLEQLTSLAELIEETGLNSQVHCVLIRSLGDQLFCSGANFDQMANLKDITAAENFFSGFASLIQSIRKCPVPVVSIVEGKVVGGGLGIVATSDMALANTNAELKLSELSIGIGPYVIAPAIERKIGVAKLSNLSLSTKWHSAHWAKESGLYHEIYQTGSELEAAIDAFVTNFSSYSRESLVNLKQALWENTPDWESLLDSRARLSAKLALSKESKTLVAKFLDKKS